MNSIDDTVTLDDYDVRERFIRATAPGAHHLTRAATAVELRVKIDALPIPLEARDRLRQLAGHHVTSRGVLIVQSRAHRSQQKNREAARARLLALLSDAANPPEERRPTAPGPLDRERRLSAKHRKAAKKQTRRGNPRREE